MMFVPESSEYVPTDKPAQLVADTAAAQALAAGAPPLGAAARQLMASRLAVQDGTPRTLYATHDFFQEWASARNYLEGLPLYTHQNVAVVRYLDWPLIRDTEGLFIEYSSRPPTYVLFILPFGFLDYPTAFLVWNLLSLAAFALSLYLVAHHLQIGVTAKHLLPIVVLSLLASPLKQQVFQGNINLVLLPILLGVWLADSASKPVLAGILLGIAIALKIFPGLLLLYFVVLRKYRTVVSTVACTGAIFAISLLVFGFQSYQDYVQLSMPFLAPHRGNWDNLSLIGFWTRLFVDQDVFGSVQTPLVDAPLLARSLISASGLLLILFLAWWTWRANTPEERTWCPEWPGSVPADISFTGLHYLVNSTGA